MHLHDAINKSLDLLQTGELSLSRDNTPMQCFGFGPTGLSVKGGENVLEFNRLVNFLYEKDNDVFKSYSRKSFLDRLITLIRPKKLANQKFNKEEAQTFYSSLKDVEKIRYRVMREIFGVSLSDLSHSYYIGNFKIFHFPSQKDSVAEIIGSTITLMCTPKEPIYLIEYEVEAREHIRAIEIADEKFNKFVLFLRHIIGSSDDRYEVGILDYYGWRARSAHVISQQGYSANAERIGPIEPIPIDNPYFINKNAGYDKLWMLIDKQNRTKLEKRISTAVEWIGRSLFERTVQTAFIEASVALESIFTYQEKAIITPSILSQITESVAMIVGETPDQRLEIEKEIKDLYSIRSGIVHSGDKDIDKKDFEIFIYYIRLIVQILLTNPQYAECETIEELYEYLKRQKYS